MAAALLSARTHRPETADDRLATRIQRQLSADSRAVSRLQIEVEGGVVTLRGVATSFYQKQLWLHGTKSVVGDSARINDEISVTSKWEDTDFGWRD
jgi:osmotically-inducible protein OsmY